MGVRKTWKNLLDRRDVLIVDVETTGLSNQDEVIEIAVMNTQGDTLFDSLVFPKNEVSSVASAIHGLTRALLRKKGAPPWRKVHKEVVGLLDEAQCVLAWNAPFDKRLLKNTARKYRKKWPDLPWRDLLRDYRKLRPDVSAKLCDAASREGVASERKHRARDDCKTALEVMRKCSRRRKKRQ